MSSHGDSHREAGQHSSAHPYITDRVKLPAWSRGFALSAQKPGRTNEQTCNGTTQLATPGRTKLPSTPGLGSARRVAAGDIAAEERARAGGKGLAGGVGSTQRALHSRLVQAAVPAPQPAAVRTPPTARHSAKVGSLMAAFDAMALTPPAEATASRKPPGSAAAAAASGVRPSGARTPGGPAPWLPSGTPQTRSRHVAPAPPPRGEPPPQLQQPLHKQPPRGTPRGDSGAAVTSKAPPAAHRTAPPHTPAAPRRPGTAATPLPAAPAAPEPCPEEVAAAVSLPDVFGTPARCASEAPGFVGFGEQASPAHSTPRLAEQAEEEGATPCFKSRLGHPHRVPTNAKPPLPLEVRQLLREGEAPPQPGEQRLGSCQVLTPVRSTAKLAAALGGGEKVLTPVRRSARKGAAGKQAAAAVEPMLEATNYCYCPPEDLTPSGDKGGRSVLFDMGALKGGLITKWPLCLAHDAACFFAPCANDVRVYSTASGDHVETLRGHTAEVTAVALDPSSSTQVYTASLDGTLRLWSYAEGTCLRTYPLQEPVEGLVVSPLLGLAYVALRHRGGEAGRVAACQLPSGDLLPGRLKTRGAAPRLAISASGATVAALERASLLVWHAGADLNARPLNFHHVRALTCVALDASGGVLAAGDVSGRILLWRGVAAALAEGRVPAATTVHWHAHAVGCLAFSSDGLHLLSGGREGVLVQWQLSSGKRAYLPRLGGALCGLLAAPSHPSRYLLSQSDNSVRWLDAGAWRVEGSVHGLRPPPPSAAAAGAGAGAGGWDGAALQPGSGHLVVAARGAALQFYDAARDAHAARMQVAPRSGAAAASAAAAASGGIYGAPSEPSVTALAFSGDGGAMATVDARPDGGACGSVECCLRFWDRAGGGGGVAGAAPYALNTRVDSPHRGLVTGLAFHPGRDAAATCSDDGEYRMWARGGGGGGGGGAPPAGWCCTAVGAYKGRALRACAYSGDGSLLAVGAGAGVALWRAATNAAAGALVAPAGAGGGGGDAVVTRVAFLAGSARLVGTLEGAAPAVVVWDLLRAAPVWTLALRACALAAAPSGARFAVGVDGGGEGGGGGGAVLVFGAADWRPLSVALLPSGQRPAALLYAPRGTPLAAGGRGSGAAAAAAAGPPLLALTADRHYIVLGGGGDGGGGGAAGGSGEVGGGDAPAAAGARRSVLEEVVGGAAGPSGAVAGALDAGALDAGAAQRAVAALMDAPSHVLPPPSMLAPAMLERLVLLQPQ